MDGGRQTLWESLRIRQVSSLAGATKPANVLKCAINFVFSSIGPASMARFQAGLGTARTLAPTLLFKQSPYTTPYLVEGASPRQTTLEAEAPNLGLPPL